MVGTTLSIHVTVAVLLPVFPTRSENVNIKDPFHVKRYPVAFNQVIVSVNQLMVASTS